MADKQDINVDTINTPTPVSTLIKTLCETSCEIRDKMCLLLSKPDFNHISVNDMCGQGKNKISKQYLAKNIIHFIKSIDIINDSLNPVFSCQTLSEALNNICDANNNQSELDSINQQLINSSGIAVAVDNAMKQHKDDIEKKLGELCEVVKGLTVGNSSAAPQIFRSVKIMPKIQVHLTSLHLNQHMLTIISRTL